MFQSCIWISWSSPATEGLTWYCCQEIQAVQPPKGWCITPFAGFVAIFESINSVFPYSQGFKSYIWGSINCHFESKPRFTFRYWNLRSQNQQKSMFCCPKWWFCSGWVISPCRFGRPATCRRQRIGGYQPPTTSQQPCYACHSIGCPLSFPCCSLVLVLFQSWNLLLLNWLAHSLHLHRPAHFHCPTHFLQNPCWERSSCLTFKKIAIQVSTS